MRFVVVKDEHRKFPDKEIILPTVATGYSAGYDIYSNKTVEIFPNEIHVFWTDIKVKLDNGQFLMLVPRSSIGIKKHIMLANTIGVIDKDYYDNPDNDGNIAIALYNYGIESILIKDGERIVQGIGMPYIMYKTSEDKLIRTGGLGSTGE